MRIGVVVFPGSNCDRDCAHVFERVLELPVRMIWHEERELGGVDAVILPGGFSFGDHLRTGAIARVSPVMAAVAAFAARGGPVVGICNGFQILLEAGLLPGAMLRNRSLRFVCRAVGLRCVSGRTPLTRGLDGARLTLPIAHAEGFYYIDDDGLKALQDHEQIVLRYVDDEGEPTYEANPNGSVFNIAGVCDRAGNVIGLMPHPERACEAALGNVDGLRLFEALVGRS